MPGFFGYFGRTDAIDPVDTLIDTIDPLGHGDSKTLSLENGFLSVSWLKNDSILSPYFYFNSKYSACFSGDLIDFERFPWERILSDIEKEEYSYFSEFKAPFSFAAFDNNKRRFYLVSDKTSQYPFYYYIHHTHLLFSTSLATFCRLSDRPDFNVKWLYEFLFFNYPIGQTTFLSNVFRMPPATIYTYDTRSNKSFTQFYSQFFARTHPLLKRKEAFDYAESIFRKRIPEYFNTDCQKAVALTGGLDARTILSMAPPESSGGLTTYTYGVPGCHDLKAAAEIASCLDSSHREIHFDSDFLEHLPGLAYETVFLSHGLETVARSTLPYVYRTLTEGGTQFPVVISGVSGDHLFRDHIMGHGNVPSLISNDFMKAFHTGELHINKSLFSSAFKDTYIDFETHIFSVFDCLRSIFGDMNHPEAYLSFLLYETSTKHFAGEASIANNFSKFRAPFWDTDIILLPFQIEYGVLGFSETYKKKDKFKESYLQASLIIDNAQFSNTYFNGLPLKTYVNNQLLFPIKRLIRRGPYKLMKTLKPEPIIPLEGWEKWFDEILYNRVFELTTNNSLLSKYFNICFLSKLIYEKNVHWIGKFLTIEVILDLLKKKWRK